MDVRFLSLPCYITHTLSLSIAHTHSHTYIFVTYNCQVQGDVLVLYVYQLKTDDSGAETVAVEKVSFRKQGGATS